MPPAHTHQTVLRQSFDELDAVRERVAGWDLDLLQLDQGPFRGYLHQWQSGPLFLTRAQFGRKLSQRGASPNGGLTLAVPVSDAFDVRWRGQQVGMDHILVFPDSGELDAVSSSAFHVVTITWSAADWLQSQIDAPEVCERVAAHLGRACRASPEVMRRLRRALHRSEARPDGTAARHVNAVQTLALEAVCSAGGHGSMQHPSDRRRVLRTAVKYMDARLHRTIRVADLCRTAGVSERTLQYAFRSEFGLSPMAYLHARRLHGVRAELLRSAPQRGIIARVARAHGLRHAGRFSSDYRDLFGELPAHTLTHRSA